MIVDETNLPSSDEEDERTSHTGHQHQPRQQFNHEEMALKFNRMELARRQLIAEIYQPKHRNLFVLTEDIFVPSFLQAVKMGTPEALMSILKRNRY